MALVCLLGSGLLSEVFCFMIAWSSTVLYCKFSYLILVHGFRSLSTIRSLPSSSEIVSTDLLKGVMSDLSRVSEVGYVVPTG